MSDRRKALRSEVFGSLSLEAMKQKKKLKKRNRRLSKINNIDTTVRVVQYTSQSTVTERNVSQSKRTRTQVDKTYKYNVYGYGSPANVLNARQGYNIGGVWGSADLIMMICGFYCCGIMSRIWSLEGDVENMQQSNRIGM